MDFNTIKYTPGIYEPIGADYIRIIVTDQNIFSFCPDNGLIYLLNAKHPWYTYTFKKYEGKLCLVSS